MAYVSKDSLIKQFGEKELIQLTDRSRTGSVDDAVLNVSIANACSEADSYIGAVYSLPLPAVPEVLVKMAGDITRFHLYNQQASEEVQNRYDRAVAWLKDLARGVVKLIFPEGTVLTEEQTTEPTVAASSSRSQVFTDDTFNRMGPKWPTRF
jgi:phage gp36-like protein